MPDRTCIFLGWSVNLSNFLGLGVEAGASPMYPQKMRVPPLGMPPPPPPQSRNLRERCTNIGKGDYESMKSWAQRERVVTVFFIIFQERQKTFSFFFKANPRDVN